MKNKYFRISLRKNMVLFCTRIIFLKMSARPKRSVSRVNYCKLADVKVPRRTRCTKVNGASFSESSTLNRLKILERDDDNNRVKVRYVGYSRKFDEWRKADDIVDLNESDNSSDEETSSLLGRKQLSKFCLFEELACQIKLSLVGNRKADPVCSIIMSFDSLHFEVLIRRSVRNGTKGKREAYGLSSLSKLDDLLGERWYMRGLNSAGDFCYIEPGTIKFYLKCQHQKIDFQLQDDGSMKTQYFGNRHHLVFQFVRSDGTLAQWNSVFHSCNS